MRATSSSHPSFKTSPSARRWTSLLLALSLLLGLVLSPAATLTTRAEIPPETGTGPVSDALPETSGRLIVELTTPSLTAAIDGEVKAAAVNGQLNVNAPEAQAYVNRLQSEQSAFLSEVQRTLDGVQVSTFINELGAAEAATYQITFNGVALDTRGRDVEAVRTQLERLDSVKNVYQDYIHHSQLYTSTALINAPVVWNSDAIGGIGNAGAGIKVASMDAGLHRDAPMFSGEGYEYPDGYGPDGLGLTANNNGKIIVSRAYYRPWDPPLAGDANPWPGEEGSSHGVHTGSTAAGNVVENVEYLGFNVGTMSGVAPRAYVGSYKVFYPSNSGGSGSFYTIEGIAALEDVVADGMDVVNNSWGGGPASIGGEFDALDAALVNAWNAGVFVSMSAGNAGPGQGTGDHPSPEYINVAASTTSGTLASGRVDVPGSPVQDVPFGTADFGEPLEIGQVLSFPFVTAAAVDPGNVEGCAPFAPGTFDGVAAVISRGTCQFSTKALNAQNAGAILVVIYNNVDGDQIINLAGGEVAAQVTIPSISLTENDGNAVVEYYATNPDGATIVIDTQAFQAGNTPDFIIDFSSRGPAVNGLLKPDVAAPGVNILAQGYDPQAEGEARHLGFGQSSGTSMAAPHVAGAAALLQQIYPDWSNAEIKSALMSTAKYIDVFAGSQDDPRPAQPLDMGAGRIDVAAAVNPGVILDPPSLSFGRVLSGTESTLEVSVTSVADAAETYVISTLGYTDTFTSTFAVPGVSASAESVTLAPGETATVTVTFAAGADGIGDNQGYIVMDGATYDAHMPMHARVLPAQQAANVLLVDADYSDGLGLTDYQRFYTEAMDEAGLSYNVVETFIGTGVNPATIPSASELAAYEAVVIFTGDHFQPDGSFAVPTAFTEIDLNRLTDYLNLGGGVVVMGQDFASVVSSATTDDGEFFYGFNLAANYIQDSISDSGTPAQPIIPTADAPAALDEVLIDLTQPQLFAATLPLSGTQEVPPVETETTGEASLLHYEDFNQLDYTVTVNASITNPITVTAAHIHSGTAGTNGPVIYPLFTEEDELPQLVTDTLTLEGSLMISEDDEALLVAGNAYVNVHSTDNPAGEVRGQIDLEPEPNQIYVDEISTRPTDGSFDPRPNSADNAEGIPLFRYAGPYNLQDGIVAIANAAQPSLETPGVTYQGRSLYATFGLEGMSNELNASTGITPTTRAELIDLAYTYVTTEPMTPTISNVTTENESNLTIFAASLPEGDVLEHRWDWGDGSDLTAYFETQFDDESGEPIVAASHTYLNCGTYEVRVEVVDALGDHHLGEQTVDITENCAVALTEVTGTAGGLQISVDFTSTALKPVSGTIDVVDTSAIELPADASLLGEAFTIVAYGPDGLLMDDFDPAVQLTISYGGEEVQSSQLQSVTLRRYSALDERWEIVSAATDTDAGTITADIERNGIFGVFAIAPTADDESAEPVQLDNGVFLPLVGN